jgi:hypothetical protein
MALCNLATLNESVRSRVIKDAEFINSIEGFMFEEHILLRRASVQCWTNLCTSPLMVKRCEGKNDKVQTFFHLVFLWSFSPYSRRSRGAVGWVMTKY